MHGDIQKWLRENKDIFSCGLSLDGTKDMHNINRSNSFDNIDLKFFLETYPLQPVKMTISAETLPSLYEGVKFCHDLGFQVNCNLAYGIDWSNRSFASILESELHKLIKYYIERPEVKPCSLLEASILNVAFVDAGQRRWCGAGKNVRAYDVDGNLYPCQFFMPLTAGDEIRKDIAKITFYDIIPHELEVPECRDCKIKAACPTCYGSNFISTGNIYQRDMNLCRLSKIILKARSYFKALQWERGLISMPNEIEQALLRSIITIQNVDIT